jgi:hypothetical protein
MISVRGCRGAGEQKWRPGCSTCLPLGAPSSRSARVRGGSQFEPRARAAARIRSTSAGSELDLEFVAPRLNDIAEAEWTKFVDARVTRRGLRGSVIPISSLHFLPAIATERSEQRKNGPPGLGILEDLPALKEMLYELLGAALIRRGV